MSELSGPQKKKLKSLAHAMKPVVIIGHKGLTENLIMSIDQALNDHELIKIKFNDFKDEKDVISRNILDTSGAALVALIGNVLILYRESRIEEKRRIKL